MSPRFIVTGTDTGIGKTVFAAALCQALGAEYWKPVQSGLEEETDSETVARLAGLDPARIHAERYRLAMPASPHRAAAAEGVAIEATALTPPATRNPLVIEGAGGVLVPLAPDLLFADVFAGWGFPVILCARTTLGTINHSLLSIEALRARGIPILGVAFVGDADAENEAIIPRIGGVRRLGRLARIEALDPAALARAFDAGFDKTDFMQASA
jgi:dethiobiotin synthetase